MTSSEVQQELELFDQTVSILDQAKIRDENIKHKYQNAVQRLKTKVTFENASKALDDAIKRDDADDKRIAQRALGVLIDSLPKEVAQDILRKGLSHTDSSTRASSIIKFSDLNVENPEVFLLICERIMDVDTKVSDEAAKAIQKYIVNNRVHTAAVLQFLEGILADKISSKGPLMTDQATSKLRIWDMYADLYRKSPPDSALRAHVESLLGSLLTSLETWNDDVLFVLNQLEIAANLPRDIFAGKSQKLILNLLRYANEQEIVADDALRVLAALHFSNENSSSLPQFFQALDNRLTQDHFSMASLDVFALFAGSSTLALRYVLDRQKGTGERWIGLITKFLHGGNESPRNVSLDALALFLRGGSLLKEPLNSSSNVFASDPILVSSRADFSLMAWELLKENSASVLKSIFASIRSLHPQIQIAAYGAIRMLVSQNSRWGISKVFEYIDKDTLLAAELPSPNTNFQVMEARKNAISACALKWLTEDEDAPLVNSIKAFIKASADGTLYKLNNATVDVAVMRA